MCRRWNMVLSLVIWCSWISHPSRTDRSRNVFSPDSDWWLHRVCSQTVPGIQLSCVSLLGQEGGGGGGSTQYHAVPPISHFWEVYVHKQHSGCHINIYIWNICREVGQTGKPIVENFTLLGHASSLLVGCRVRGLASTDPSIYNVCINASLIGVCVQVQFRASLQQMFDFGFIASTQHGLI